MYYFNNTTCPTIVTIFNDNALKSFLLYIPFFERLAGCMILRQFCDLDYGSIWQAGGEFVNRANSSTGGARYCSPLQF